MEQRYSLSVYGRKEDSNVFHGFAEKDGKALFLWNLPLFCWMTCLCHLSKTQHSVAFQMKPSLLFIEGLHAFSPIFSNKTIFSSHFLTLLRRSEGHHVGVGGWILVVWNGFLFWPVQWLMRMCRHPCNNTLMMNHCWWVILLFYCYLNYVMAQLLTRQILLLWEKMRSPKSFEKQSFGMLEQATPTTVDIH